MAGGTYQRHISLSAWRAHGVSWLRMPGVLAGGAVVAGLLGGALAIKSGRYCRWHSSSRSAVGVAILLDARVGLYAAVAVICLLPYATLPVKVGLTFTLLEAATLLTIAVWVLRLGFDRSELILTTPALRAARLFRDRDGRRLPGRRGAEHDDADGARLPETAARRRHGRARRQSAARAARCRPLHDGIVAGGAVASGTRDHPPTAACRR